MCEERYLTFYLVEQVNLALLLPHVNELVSGCPFRAAGPAGEYLFPILLLGWVPRDTMHMENARIAGIVGVPKCC